MADYRRAHQPGGAFFFTVVTHQRRPIFADTANVDRLRTAVRAVMHERPFDFLAGVVLPDHAHYLWTLPSGDGDFSTRIGRMKALFTKSLVGWAPLTTSRSPSRIKHRDSDIWQRRFWEHTIRDQDDFSRHLDYIHFNPVKHGLARCPHEWPASSFENWVERGCYDATGAANAMAARRACPISHGRRPSWSRVGIAHHATEDGGRCPPYWYNRNLHTRKEIS